MIRRHFAWFVALMVIVAGSFAVTPAAADAHWEKLGQQTVNGKPNQVDTDTIMVGASKGSYTTLQVKVEKSALRMIDMKVHFGDGTVFDVSTAFVFGVNQTTRLIDLPGNARIITKVVFRYTNLNDGKGDARVELWGRDVSGSGSGGTTTTASPAASSWKKLGERTVNGRPNQEDRDTITVGADDGAFTAVQVKVENSALKMHDMKITFGDGSVQDVATAFVFGPNQLTRVIDLPGNKRIIRKVDFRYSNLPGGGNARVELWGRR